MANIRVTCPTCGKMLEVGAEHAGQEVECGECFQVFVAEAPPRAKIKGAPTPGGPPGVKGRTRRRRQDEDDDYEHDHEQDEYDDDDYEPPRQRRGGGGGTAVAGLTVGILALLTSCCPLTGIGLGVLAMVLGSTAKKQTDGSGAGTAATVLGSIAFVISIVSIIWLISRA